MKKILLFVISFLILPVISYAASPVNNVNYKIKQDYIEAYIQPNGDVKVKQLLVYDGSFNGVFAKIVYDNPGLSTSSLNYENNDIYNFDGVNDFKLSAKSVNRVSFDTFNEGGFERFDKVSYASKGDQYKYVVDDPYGYYKYTIYHATHNDKVAFLLEYTLDNAVVMHPDVAELYWQILDDDPDKDEESDVRVRVYLPESDTKETFRIWTHDILSSNINYIEKNGELIGFEASADKVGHGDQFDVRTTFNKNLITDSSSLDYFDGEGFSGILKVEEKRAEEANQERERLRRIYNFFKVVAKVLLGAIGAGFLFILYLLRKPKVDFNGVQYYREFIDDYNVEVIDYLFNKQLTPNALSAAIMNLIYLKKVTAEEVKDEKKKLLDKSKDYKFTLIDREGLDESNTKLVEFLFDKVGNGTEFTTKGLKKYASSLSTGSKFNTSYTSWNREVISQGKKQEFFKSKTTPTIIAIILLLLSILFVALGAGQGVDYWLLYLTLPAAFVLVIYVAAAKAYNEKGTLHLKKWKAFKNFLNDFGSFDIKELPEVALWERYLVYAVIFGLAKKVQKDMNVKIKELEDMGQSFDSMSTFTNIYIYDSIRSSFARAVTDGRRSYAASRANAYSSSSSGGGFGGGGSFGGGFGGGGGSHGGF